MLKLTSLVFYFYLSFGLIALWAVSQAWISQSRTETIHPFKAFVHLLAFYLSYLLFPLFFFSLYAGWSGYYLSAASILSLIAFMLIRETKNEDVNNQI